MKLGGMRSGGDSKWVELDYVGLEIMLGIMEGNEETEYKSGKEELGFGRHGNVSRSGVVLGFSDMFLATDWRGI